MSILANLSPPSVCLVGLSMCRMNLPKNQISYESIEAVHQLTYPDMLSLDMCREQDRTQFLPLLYIPNLLLLLTPPSYLDRAQVVLHNSSSSLRLHAPHALPYRVPVRSTKILYVKHYFHNLRERRTYLNFRQNRTKNSQEILKQVQLIGIDGLINKCMKFYNIFKKNTHRKVEGRYKKFQICRYMTSHIPSYLKLLISSLYSPVCEFFENYRISRTCL